MAEEAAYHKVASSSSGVPEADSAFVRRIEELLDAKRYAEVRNRMLALHAADQADLIDQVSGDDRKQLLALIRDAFDPQVLANLDSSITAEVLGLLGRKEAAQALSTLDTDEAIGVLEEIPESDQQALLEYLPDEQRAKMEEGLSYPERSAGRMMRKDIVLAPEYWTVGNAIDYLRGHESLPDEFYSIFVVDARNRPVGSVLLSQILRSRRDVPVGDLMSVGIRQIPVAMDQEEVAHLFRKYNLVSAPVVQGEGRILGVITIDDVAEVIEEEADEDLLRLGGVAGQDFHAAIPKTMRRRFPWLFVNLLTALLASFVVSQFSATIEQLVVLAALMPIVASMGGNAGTQAMTISVRALATKDLTEANALRVIGKETLVGWLNGMAFAVICALTIFAWQRDVTLALVFAGAMAVNLTVAGLCGVVIPVVLSRMKVDPAISSGVFLTTLTDVIGFFVFLGLATVILL